MTEQQTLNVGKSALCVSGVNVSVTICLLVPHACVMRQLLIFIVYQISGSVTRIFFFRPPFSFCLRSLKQSDRRFLPSELFRFLSFYLGVCLFPSVDSKRLDVCFFEILPLFFYSTESLQYLLFSRNLFFLWVERFILSTSFLETRTNLLIVSE